MSAVPEVIGRYLRAIETGDAEGLRACLAPGMRQVEWPNRIQPKGNARDVAGILADFDKGRALLRRQSYEVSAVHGGDESLMVELVWRGTLALPVAALAPGDEMVAHCAIAFELRDGLIVSQRNYDCFDPF